MTRLLISATFLAGFAFAGGVKVRFDPSTPAIGPHPTDAFTVPVASLSLSTALAAMTLAGQNHPGGFGTSPPATHRADSIRPRATGAEQLGQVWVHLENFMTVPATTLAGAKGAAAGLLANVGVRLEWKEGEPRPSESPAGRAEETNEILEVQFDDSAPRRFPPDAMAYAVPGRIGICIHVFYSRVKSATSRDRVPGLLGHVLAHEIVHVLEGSARHSPDGLMKAHWTSADYMRMATNPLLLAEEDVRLLRRHFNKSKSTAQ